MSATPTANACGCCEGIGVETPLAIYNRPGLTAIAYRAGTYGSFRQSLLARLSDSKYSALRELRTRDNDDFTIALLDAWAIASEVLSFYQERIANESYLRTARERLSVLEQSRLLGYQLAPGLAASTHLAFTMESAPGAPEQTPQPVNLAIGTRVQSVPGPEEKPQTFETIEAIEARVEWNAMVPQLTHTQTLAVNMKKLWVAGANLTLAVGDVLLLIADSGGTKQAALQRITQITAEPDADRTAVALTAISTTQTVSADDPSVFVMRAVASPFGHNAPKKPVYSNGIFQNDFTEWPLDSESTSEITLSSRYEKILPGGWTVIEQDNPANSSRMWTFSRVNTVRHVSVAKYGIAGSVTRIGLSNGWTSNSDSTLALLRSMTVSAQSEELAIAELPLTFPVYGSTLALNTHVEGLSAGRPIAISGKRQRVRIKRGAEKLPSLQIDDNGSVVVQSGDGFLLAAAPALIAGSVATVLTPEEFGTALAATRPPRLRLQVIDRDGKVGRLDISAGAIELIAATENDESISEIAFIDNELSTAIEQDRDRTTLHLARPLVNVYERASARINANVAAATHGESVKELLGSGDARIAYQSFTLKQPPLTYVGADTPSGAASTLKMYVNDVLWHEAPFLYGHGPNEHIYVTQRDDEGRTTIRFGDGISGARLPSGQNNVRAEYRKGTGLGGLVRAGQLSQLLSRPLGLKEVINPQEAEGAEDPESRDDARKNAPTTVLTLDRAVSLQDYEDFARTFAGIAKAQAVWVWDGRKRSIFITIAGVAGEALEADGPVIAKLQEALRDYGDPFVAFTIKTYRRAQFQIHGTVTIDADHVIETVMTAVIADLRRRYGFDARAFGQPVALSEAIAAIQSTPGVVAVDIDKFYRNDAPVPTSQPRLIADRPAMGAEGIVTPAELLLLDETSLSRLKATQ